MFRAEAEVRTVTSDALTGMRVVRAFGQEHRERERFAVPNQTAAQLGYQAGAMIGTTRPPMELVTELVLVGVWGVGAWMFAADKVTIGLLITFAGYLGRFFWPVGQLVELIQDWARVTTASRRLLQLIDAPADRPAVPPQGLTRVQGRIDLDQVSFSYGGGQQALQEVSLRAELGEMIGLVGHTGAGKSTVLNLIAGLYQMNEGTVQLDGLDIQALAASDLKDQFGIVLQDTYGNYILG